MPVLLGVLFHMTAKESNQLPFTAHLPKTVNIGKHSPTDEKNIDEH